MFHIQLQVEPLYKGHTSDIKLRLVRLAAFGGFFYCNDHFLSIMVDV